MILKASNKITLDSSMFPQILPFDGSVQLNIERIELPTISSNVKEPSPPIQTPESQDHVTFSTGLLTIIIFTFATVIISRLSQDFSFTIYSSSQGYIITLLLTTIIPVFWTSVNNQLYKFAIRIIKSRISC